MIDHAAISACEKGSRWHEASGMLSEMRLPLGADSDHLQRSHSRLREGGSVARGLGHLVGHAFGGTRHWAVQGYAPAPLGAECDH